MDRSAWQITAAQTAYHPEGDGDLAVMVELSQGGEAGDMAGETLFPFIRRATPTAITMTGKRWTRKPWLHSTITWREARKVPGSPPGGDRERRRVGRQG